MSIKAAKPARTICALAVLTLALGTAYPVLSQSDEELELRFSRDFGYSSGTGRIQGRFSIRVNQPEGLARVVFYFDGEAVGEAAQAPFRFQFDTGDYSLGAHTLSATGYTPSGRELHSPEYWREFVSPEEGWQAAMKIALPIIGIALLATLLSAGIPFLLGGKKRARVPLGARRNYGYFGGAICPKCKSPFARHIWGLNVGVGKLERCPHCRKWSVVRRALPEELAAAEAAELEAAEPEGTLELSEEERLRRDLENSRYQDL